MNYLILSIRLLQTLSTDPITQLNVFRMMRKNLIYLRKETSILKGKNMEDDDKKTIERMKRQRKERGLKLGISEKSLQ